MSTTTTELTTTDQFIETELKKFETNLEITKEGLIELAASVKDLSIKDVNDKEGLKAVEAGRKLLKGKRVSIEKEAKRMRESATRFNKAVIARENEFVALLEPTESVLAERETWYYGEKERIRLDDEKKESDRIQAMLDQLNDYNYAVDFHELKALTDEQFQSILIEAKEKYEERARLMLIERQKEEERIRLEVEAKKQEEERLKKQREEQEERERIFQEEQAKVRSENERLKKEQYDLALALQKREEDIERKERKSFQKAELERTKKEAEEKSRLETEARIKREIQEKVEREQKEKEEKEQALLFGEDSDRFSFLAQQIEVSFINSAVWSHMKSKKGKLISYEVHEHLKQAMDLCKKYKSNRKAVLVMKGEPVDD